MHNSRTSSPRPKMTSDTSGTANQDSATDATVSETIENADRNMSHETSFWHDRLIELGLLLSMALYYLIGNQNIKVPGMNFIGTLAHLDARLSLPFLLLFVILAWYRLPFAVALLPFTLPFYLAPKIVYGSGDATRSFSPAEITLWICVAIAVLQFLIKRKQWRYKLSFAELRDRIGPFAIPMLVFVLAALISITVALSRGAAIRTFREEILGPLLYLVLIIFCLRTRQDMVRLLLSLFGTGFVVALIGVAQYFFFKSTFTVGIDGTRAVSAVYGSKNSVGLLFDYTLPIGLALIFSRLSWPVRLLVFLLCMPCFFVLVWSQSQGAAIVAFPLALLFIIVLSIRNNKGLIIAGLSAALLVLLVGGLFHQQIYSYVDKHIINGHSDQREVNTVQKRVYLWISASEMIHDSPWMGYGLDNWLCHYADPHKLSRWKPKPDWAHTCKPAPKYYILTKYQGKSTYMYDEPDLSHPHNIFLHVWVSMGIFGLLAFVTVLVLFYGFFFRIMHLSRGKMKDREQFRWMLIGISGAMLAALIQGMADSAFLEQDLSFCFWTLVASLLVLRYLSGLSWDEIWLLSIVKKRVATEKVS